MLKSILNFSLLLTRPIRHPFQTLQKALGIQEEWKQTRSLLSPHRYKILFFGGILAFPYYRDLLNSAKLQLYSQAQEELQSGQPIDIIVQSFMKQTVQEILRDQLIQTESVQFVDRLAKQGPVQDSIVSLLKDSIKNQLFLQDAQIFGKGLVLELVKDKEVEQAVVDLVIRVCNDPQVKFEIKEVFKWAANEDDVKDSIVDLLKKTGDDPIFKTALGNVLGSAANDVLMKKETSERLRMFAYFLLESESTHDQSVKGVIDLIVDKAMKKKSESSKEKEFDKIIKELQMNYRMEDTESRNQGIQIRPPRNSFF